MSSRTPTIYMMLLAVHLFVGNPAEAQEASDGDKQFVADAASGGVLEVRLGEYASQHAKSDEVKKFGEQMAGDHETANQELETIASQKSIEVPRQLNDADQKVLDRLEKLSGADFDKQYMSQMIGDHEKNIAAFEKEVADGKEVSVKGFAEKSLPMLKHHLAMARELAGS